MTGRLIGALAILSGVLLATAACGPDPEQRELQYFPDMYRNPAVKPQEEYPFFKVGSAMLAPPEGTLPQGDFTPYPYELPEGERAGEELVNPLPRTREVLLTGQKYYNIHCAVCHGKVGAGDGLATRVHREQGMPIPPSLYTEKISDWKDGQIYHTIMVGQGQMPGYAARIAEEHRWAIVHYVRALGIAGNPTEDQLETADRLGWDAATRDPKPRSREEIMNLQSVFTLNANAGEGG